MIFTVLGASGFIGRHLVPALAEQGHEVFAPAKGARDVFTRPLGHVLYCIGLTADFRSRPFDTVRAHVGYLADVLEHAQFDSLLYLSSTRVYARATHATEDAAIPVDPRDPSDHYNISKLAGESTCRASGRGGVKVARLSNVVGHDPHGDNFLSGLVREARAGRIALQTHPDSAKDYIGIDDVVQLLPRIALEGRAACYNVASGVNVTHRAIVARLAELTGCEVRLRDDAPRQQFPAIDTALLRREFGHAPASVLELLPRLLDPQ